MERSRSPVRKIMRNRPSNSSRPGDGVTDSSIKSSQELKSVGFSRSRFDSVDLPNGSNDLGSNSYNNPDERPTRKRQKTSICTDVYGQEYVSILQPEPEQENINNIPTHFDDHEILLQFQKILFKIHSFSDGIHINFSCEEIFKLYCKTLELRWEVESKSKTESRIRRHAIIVEVFSGSFYWEEVEGPYLIDAEQARQHAFATACVMLITKFGWEIKYRMNISKTNCNLPAPAALTGIENYQQTAQNIPSVWNPWTNSWQFINPVNDWGAPCGSPIPCQPQNFFQAPVPLQSLSLSPPPLPSQPYASMPNPPLPRTTPPTTPPRLRPPSFPLLPYIPLLSELPPPLPSEPFIRIKPPPPPEPEPLLGSQLPSYPPESVCSNGLPSSSVDHVFGRESPLPPPEPFYNGLPKVSPQKQLIVGPRLPPSREKLFRELPLPAPISAGVSFRESNISTSTVASTTEPVGKIVPGNKVVLEKKQSTRPRNLISLISSSPRVKWLKKDEVCLKSISPVIAAFAEAQPKRSSRFTNEDNAEAKTGLVGISASVISPNSTQPPVLSPPLNSPSAETGDALLGNLSQSTLSPNVIALVSSSSEIKRLEEGVDPKLISSAATTSDEAQPKPGSQITGSDKETMTGPLEISPKVLSTGLTQLLVSYEPLSPSDTETSDDIYVEAEESALPRNLVSTASSSSEIEPPKEGVDPNSIHPSSLDKGQSKPESEFSSCGNKETKTELLSISVSVLSPSSTQPPVSSSTPLNPSNSEIRDAGQSLCFKVSSSTPELHSPTSNSNMDDSGTSLPITLCSEVSSTTEELLPLIPNTSSTLYPQSESPPSTIREPVPPAVPIPVLPGLNPPVKVSDSPKLLSPISKKPVAVDSSMYEEVTSDEDELSLDSSSDSVQVESSHFTGDERELSLDYWSDPVQIESSRFKSFEDPVDLFVSHTCPTNHNRSVKSESMSVRSGVKSWKSERRKSWTNTETECPSYHVLYDTPAQVQFNGFQKF